MLLLPLLVLTTPFDLRDERVERDGVVVGPGAVGEGEVGAELEAAVAMC